MTSDHQQPRNSGLASKFVFGWVTVSLIWIVPTIAAIYTNWADIHPVQPSYLIAPNDEREKLVAWYATDENTSIESFKRQHAIAKAEEIPIGRHVLLLPDDLSSAQREDFTSRAETMQQTLETRFWRGVVTRFYPILLIVVLGPPLLLYFLGRGLRNLLTRWVG
jgi:hypothetical protein